MDKSFIATEAAKLPRIAYMAQHGKDETRLAQLDHLVARLHVLGLDLSDAVEHGIARFHGLKDRDVTKAWDARPLTMLVSTATWKFQAQLNLDQYGEMLTSTDRTFLRMILSQEIIMGDDMLELEQVCRRAFEVSKSIDWDARLDEWREPASDKPADPEQLDLNV